MVDREATNTLVKLPRTSVQTDDAVVVENFVFWLRLALLDVDPTRLECRTVVLRTASDAVDSVFQPDASFRSDDSVTPVRGYPVAGRELRRGEVLFVRCRLCRIGVQYGRRDQQKLCYRQQGDTDCEYLFDLYSGRVSGNREPDSSQ